MRTTVSANKTRRSLKNSPAGIAANSRQRAAVTNGRRPFLLREADGRSVRARRIRDLVDQLRASATVEGPLVDLVAPRAAALMAMIEAVESEFAAGVPADAETIDVHVRALGTIRRALGMLGISAEAVLPEDDPDDESLEAYARRRYPRPTAVFEDDEAADLEDDSEDDPA